MYMNSPMNELRSRYTTKLYQHTEKHRRIAVTQHQYRTQTRISHQESDNGKRKVIWFNPPFSKSVATNVSKSFICLVDKHFKKPTKLSIIFNRYTQIVSYSYMPNVASIITSHSKKILGNTTPDAICNCRVKFQCPMDGKCQERSIIYKAVVTSACRNEETIHWTDRARFQAAILQSPDLFSTPEMRTKYRAVNAYVDVEERKRIVQYCMEDL